MNLKLRFKLKCHIERSRDAMTPKLRYFLFLFLFFSLNTFLNAQPQNDSLTKYSYEELSTLIYNTELTDRRASKLYIDEYYKRAKKENDLIKISKIYYNLFYYYSSVDTNLAIKYTDSIIEICKDCKDMQYPALGYYGKGVLYYRKGDNSKAINNYLLALDVLKINKNISLEIDLRDAIITLQSNWLSHEGTLKFSIEHLDFIIKNKEKIKNFKETFLIAIHNLSVEYVKNEKYRKGLEIGKKGILEAIKLEDTIEYYNFVSLTGTAQYYLGNYQSAIDSSLKALPYRKNTDLAIRYYYIGKSYDKLNQPEKAQFHFLKTDSIYQATKDIFPEMRITYEHIIDYYKSKNDAENQIKYYDRLIETDKVIDSTYTYVTQTVSKKFDTPQAIAERNRLVEEAKAKESSWKYSFGIISAILLAVLGILAAAFRRQKYYKQRFENIMSIERSRNALNGNTEALEEQNTSTSLSVKKDIGIPKNVVENILKGLSKFETSKKFTKQITLTELAKNIGTNPKYLSKVINWHYQKNFSSYINELRVHHVIERLKEDSKFRNYTIKAIATEVGFGKTESFSKAFYKITEIKPSYFIKELHKRLENS